MYQITLSYNGFKRYTKIFGAADYTDNRAIPGQPGVVHNLRDNGCFTVLSYNEK